MLNFLIILAIFVAVIIGYKTGFNTGFFAIVFAYLIGGFVMGMTPKDIIGGWPVSTMFVIFSVSLFYNFALSNGTLEKSKRLNFRHGYKNPRPHFCNRSTLIIHI